MAENWRQRRLKRYPEARPNMMFREPKAINGAQCITNFAAAGAGLLAALGGLPIIVTGQIGPMLAVVVGSILVVGGLVGGFAVLLGYWWLERIALLITGLGWALLLPACLTYAFTAATTYQIWLIIALLVAALGDIFKRYLRIQWAYLDPRM